MKAEPATNKTPDAPASASAPDTATPVARSGIGTLLGLVASAALLVATLWVVTQFLTHRPLDLLALTRDVGVLAAEVLRNQGLAKESIETSEPRLERTPRAHFFHTSVEAHLSDTLDSERVMNALERAFWREDIIVSSEDAADSERSAVFSYEGFEIAEIRLHHAETRAQTRHAPEIHSAIGPDRGPAAHSPPAHDEPAPGAPASVASVAPADPAASVVTPAGQWAPAFGPLVAGERPKVAQALARVAIIVDDGGYGGEPTDIVLGLDPALTLAILPNTPHATKLAGEAQRRGFEVMLHMPMENTSPTLVHPGQLDGGMDSAELRRLTESALAQVPGAVGINNHGGSKFTANAKALGRFMEGIKDSHLFFVDSRTTRESVAFEVARQFGIPTVARTLFLDHDNDPAAIRAQFQQLMDEARKQGSAIGICHFRPNTAEFLRENLPRLAAEGIELVHVSKLVR